MSFDSGGGTVERGAAAAVPAFVARLRSGTNESWGSAPGAAARAPSSVGGNGIVGSGNGGSGYCPAGAVRGPATGGIRCVGGSTCGTGRGRTCDSGDGGVCGRCAGTRVASDGGRPAVSPCNQGGISEDWQAASVSATATDHDTAQQRAQGRARGRAGGSDKGLQRHAERPVIGGFHLPSFGEVQIRTRRTGKAYPRRGP